MRIFDNPNQLAENIIAARLRQIDPLASAQTYATRREDNTIAHYVSVDSTLPDAQIETVLFTGPTAEELTLYQNTIDQLQQIENATNPTNAQVIAAVKFLAKTLRILIRLFVKFYL